MSPAPSQTPKTIDARWIRYRSAAYLGGRGLSWGTAHDPIVPIQAIDGDKYSINVDVIKSNQTDICGTNLDIIANASMDHVFIGTRENPPINELIRKLKIGGHLVIHGVETTPETIRALVGTQGQWQEKDTYIRDNQFLGIWKLLGRTKPGILPPKPRTSKRACIARYGAIGDMIMITPLIRQLAEDGYEVTMNITPYCVEVLKNNPYVSNIVLQERDMIPNQDLGQYWSEWIPDYDKYINLSESIEGKLLKVEGRNDFYTTKAWRESVTHKNYYDFTASLGGYPELTGKCGELYFSNSEKKEAQFMRDKFKDKFMVMWALKGSSHHKLYPLLEPTLNEWLQDKPDAVVMLVGSESDAQYQFDHPQVIPLAGRMKLRDVFAFMPHADLIVGPESAITNASGCFQTPKIILLSHSSCENLCKHFPNHVCLKPETACHPCHALHYSLESCPLIEINHSETNDKVGTFPACTIGVSPQRMIAALDAVYNTRLKPQ